MSIPGFSAEQALTPIGSHRARAHGERHPAVTPAHAPAGWFWPCFRNCYDRCGGEPGAGHYDWCSHTCYYICDSMPWVYF